MFESSKLKENVVCGCQCVCPILTKALCDCLYKYNTLQYIRILPQIENLSRNNAAKKPFMCEIMICSTSSSQHVIDAIIRLQ